MKMILGLSHKENESVMLLIIEPVREADGFREIFPGQASGQVKQF